MTRKTMSPGASRNVPLYSSSPKKVKQHILSEVPMPHIVSIVTMGILIIGLKTFAV